MNVSSNLMGLYFGYNGRVGDIQTLDKALVKFGDLANNATTPQERERYAQAVDKINNEVRPKIKKEVEDLGSQLGLSKNSMGKAISLDELENTYLDLKNKPNDLPYFSDDYHPGSFFSKNI